MDFAENILFSATAHPHWPVHVRAIRWLYADPGYMDMLEARRFPRCRAAASTAPAELLATKTECTTLSFNRRYWMKNGGVLTNPGKLRPQIDQPEGGTDPSIPLLARPPGRLLSAVAGQHRQPHRHHRRRPCLSRLASRMEHEIQAAWAMTCRDHYHRARATSIISTPRPPLTRLHTRKPPASARATLQPS